ncbi:MAG: P1 family peptidase [Candidatus Hodarchaeota archaeon]
MKRHRLRELGISIGFGTPGLQNKLTDVSGVLVGHTTLIQGHGKLIPGEGPIRTGVTAILPHDGNLYEGSVVAAVHVINGFGKATGLAQLQELGRVETPILITNTLNVGLVQDAVTQYMIEENPAAGISTSTPNPIVGECHDGYLNDAQGRHVRQKHVYDAIRTAGKAVIEGCVGAGTGMIAYGCKSGVGTASRCLPKKDGGYMVGCLTVPNCGRGGDLIIAGTLVRRLFAALAPSIRPKPPASEGGSIIVILATDAPLSSRQLARIARRATIGIGRTGSVISHGSGDFVIAFSTAYQEVRSSAPLTVQREQLRDRYLTPLFAAAVEATEEAILNALCMATSMAGRDDHIVEALPLDIVHHLSATEHGKSD